MSNYNFNRFDLPNKWMEADFEKLADICEQCKKARREKREKKIVIDTILQPEAEKGN